MWISYLVKYKNNEMGTIHTALVDVSILNEDKAKDVNRKIQEAVHEERTNENPKVQWNTDSSSIIIEQVYALKASA